MDQAHIDNLARLAAEANTAYNMALRKQADEFAKAEATMAESIPLSHFVAPGIMQGHVQLISKGYERGRDQNVLVDGVSIASIAKALDLHMSPFNSVQLTVTLAVTELSTELNGALVVFKLPGNLSTPALQSLKALVDKACKERG